jgi:hypothetical protein
MHAVSQCRNPQIAVQESTNHDIATEAAPRIAIAIRIRFITRSWRHENWGQEGANAAGLFCVVC